jgi:hypothetical protein
MDYIQANLERTLKTLPSPKQTLVTAFIFIVALIITGCGREPSSDTAQSTATSAAIPAKVTANDLRKLLWIEGTWRGTGYQTPFFERYSFENDETLIVEYLTDESVSKVDRTTRYDLKDGRFGNDRSVATEVTDNYITFSSVANAKNTFRWQKESADSWKAVITSPATEKTPTREVIYSMERWPPAKL